MKNADSPATALNYYDEFNDSKTTLGLTKREHFAGLAMQAAIAAHFDADDVPTYAVSMADALLSELERTK